MTCVHHPDIEGEDLSVTPRGRIQSVREVEACAEYGFVDYPHAVPELSHFSAILWSHLLHPGKDGVPIWPKG
jgi:hypothetical protein